MIRALKFAESYFGKRKLIICFAVIVVLAIGFLYYESFYNLSNNRFRPFSPFSSKNTAKPSSNSPPAATDTLEKTKEKDSKIGILKDNQNNENKTKCWTVEKYKIIEECSRCDLFSLKFLHACQETSYKELIECEIYGLVSRSCSTPNHILSKRYWSFEFICLVLTGIFSSFVLNRKRHLEKLAMERMRQQILS